MRKQVLHAVSGPAPTPSTELDVTLMATALVTSEAADHPIENAFDANRGRGGTRWVAREAGPQTIILAFDTPQRIRRVVLEIEENEVSRTQELQVAFSSDGGRTYRELLRQEYNFSPPSTTFEREEWQVVADDVTHLRLQIRPDKGDRPCWASLTSLSLCSG